MNAPVTAEAVETAQIEAALDFLLTAAIRADRDPSLLPEAGPASAGAFVFAVLERMGSWTAAQRQSADLLARPVWELTRQGVTTLGKRLHEIGGLRLMHDVCDRVARLDEAQQGRRLDLIDKRWDGIGEWVA